MGTQLPTERGTAAPPLGPCLLWPNVRLSQQLLSSCRNSDDKVEALGTMAVVWRLSRGEKCTVRIGCP